MKVKLSRILPVLLSTLMLVATSSAYAITVECPQKSVQSHPTCCSMPCCQDSVVGNESCCCRPSVPDKKSEDLAAPGGKTEVPPVEYTIVEPVDPFGLGRQDRSIRAPRFIEDRFLAPPVKLYLLHSALLH